MKRISSTALTFSILCLLLSCTRVDAPTEPDYLEWDVLAIQAAMDQGALTSRRLVDHYVERIAAIDHGGPMLRAIIAVNPDARTIADELDAERSESGPRGPLHGIPVVLKANIDTGDRMATHAGSLALRDHLAPDDASIVRQLRDAGAVILAKANLSEWANFRSTRSTSGWSSVGLQTRNPYDPARNPCGSSSGSAVSVAANLTVLSIGTETDGSIVCPASVTGIVGIKPTLGLVSRDGIIPIAHSQDTAGPMARTVRDAALLLNAISEHDPADTAAQRRPQTLPDYASDLSADALQGRRIGVMRGYDGAGSNPAVDENFEAALEVLRGQGAEIVDELEMDTTGLRNAEFAVLLWEFKADLNAYLEASNSEIRSLTEIIAFNEANADEVMPHFGQELLEMAEAKGPLTDTEYLDALTEGTRIAREAIDATMAEHNLDALVAPTNGPAWYTDYANGDQFGIGSSTLAAVSGHPSITVPSGFAYDLPLGLSFIGGAFSDHELIKMAYAFEQARHARRPPRLD
jgi:amidase